MLKRIKRAVVESYIGAIALGYVLAQAILYFMFIFVSPFTAWLSRSYFKDIPSRLTPSGLPLYDALVDFARFVSLMILWFLLLYWLYMKPEPIERSEAPESQ